MMAKTIVALVLGTSLLVGMVQAAAEGGPQAGEPPEWQQEEAARLERQARLDELIVTLSEEMAAIRETSDLREREKLMAIHREHMLEAMSLMQEMSSDRMFEVMEEHMASGLDPESAQVHRAYGPKARFHRRSRSELSDAQRLADLEVRVDMMQIMIESLMH